MSTNGGTLHGVVQGHHTCTHCGLLFDSAASLQVHTHYHHETTINRWSGGSGGGNQQSTVPPPTTSSNSSSASPTDSDNNNQPSSKQLHRKISAASPVSSQNNTIAAAADSSDQPPTPTPIGQDPGTPQSYSGTSSPYHQQQSLPPPLAELGHYAYMHAGYDQYYHPHNPMDYGAPPLLPPPHHLNNHHSHHQSLQHHHQQQEYKPVPSSRYHPYMHNHNSSHQNNSPVTQSSLSPSVVSSSSPTTTSSSSSIQPSNTQSSTIAPGQPTPSPSPKQCDKCGLVCGSAGQLNEHYSTVHPNYTPNDSSRNNTDDSQNNDMHIINFGLSQPIKEEQPSDILDLDSQKMVYPPHDPSGDTVLPPMNTLHNLHALQRPPMSWGHDPHPFMAPHHQQEMKLGYYAQQMPTIKQEYPIIKSEYGTALPPLPSSELKQFGSDSTSGNQVTTSPNDFPTTTTPQENGPQFRTFEPPTSSHSNTGAPNIKATTWKSNEARRPKTYNCTACNKWFTSSGHLKRHYNTTLHKNAVKSSGQPDPATLPISVHHHPSRDPNSKHSRKSPAQASAAHAPAPPAPPPDPPRSPEYTPQYTPPSGFGHQQAQGFQQYTASLHSTTSNAGGPPNGQAGPSVLASQPRGLLIYSNNNNNLATIQHHHQPEVAHHPTTTTTSIIIPHHQHLQQEEALHHHLLHQHSQEMEQHSDLVLDQDPEGSSIINIINSTGQYNITNPMHTTINTNTITTPLYQVTQHQGADLPSYHSITGNNSAMHHCDSSSVRQNEQQILQYQYSTTSSMDGDCPGGDGGREHDDLPMGDDPKSDVKLAIQNMIINRLSGGAEMYQGDTAPPFSPDIPEPYELHTASASSTTSLSTAAFHHGRSATPQMADAAPHSPSSPSVSSTGTMIMGTASVGGGTPNSYNIQPQQQTTMIMGAAMMAAPKEQHRCEQCDKVFNKVCYLTQHNKTFHSGDKPYKCQRCGKRFPCDQSHEEHFAKHAGEKPFKCELCPKQFNHKTDLRRHMCVHSGAKPYACELCGKGFIRKDHMIKHLETHRRKTATQRETKVPKKYMTKTQLQLKQQQQNQQQNNQQQTTTMTKLDSIHDEYMDLNELEMA